MNEYRIAVKATVGFSIKVATEEEAIELANLWRKEMEERTSIENKIIGEAEVAGPSVSAFDVAVYLDEEVTADDIENVEEVEE